MKYTVTTLELTTLAIWWTKFQNFDLEHAKTKLTQ